MRPTFDEYLISLAHGVAARSTCDRARVGCMLVQGVHHFIGACRQGSGITRNKQGDHALLPTWSNSLLSLSGVMRTCNLSSICIAGEDAHKPKQ